MQSLVEFLSPIPKSQMPPRKFANNAGKRNVRFVPFT
jgi:hypothetical protein